MLSFDKPMTKQEVFESLIQATNTEPTVGSYQYKAVASDDPEDSKNNPTPDGPMESEEHQEGEPQTEGAEPQKDVKPQKEPSSPPKYDGRLTHANDLTSESAEEVESSTSGWFKFDWCRKKNEGEDEQIRNWEIAVEAKKIFNKIQGKPRNFPTKEERDFLRNFGYTYNYRENVWTPPTEPCPIRLRAKELYQQLEDDGRLEQENLSDEELKVLEEANYEFKHKYKVYEGEQIAEKMWRPPSARRLAALTPGSDLVLPLVLLISLPLVILGRKLLRLGKSAPKIVLDDRESHIPGIRRSFLEPHLDMV